MNEFYQIWNAVFHGEPPVDEEIFWIVECGLGDLMCLAVLIIPVMTVFAAYCKAVDWFYWTKPKQQFQRRDDIVKKTGNFAVYDMSDEELDALHDSE